MNDNQHANLPWYKDGLRFKCTECGKCCTGSPGYVWVEENEMQEIADYLKISLSDFKKKYTRQRDNRYALIELRQQDYDCVFLENKRCSIYAVRPSQCRKFPWWQQNLESPESWHEAAKYCEGINDQAPLINFPTIKHIKDN